MARMWAQYGADPRDRQANGDGRKLDGIADAVRELRGKVWSLRKIAKSLRRVYCECGAGVAVRREG